MRGIQGCTGVSANVTQRHSRARERKRDAKHSRTRVGSVNEHRVHARARTSYCHGSLDVYFDYSVGDSVGFEMLQRAGNKRLELIVKRISSFFPCRVPRHNAGAKIDGGNGDNVACETRNRIAI